MSARAWRLRAYLAQIMGVLETISPVVEQVSIDEAYLDVSGWKAS